MTEPAGSADADPAGDGRASGDADPDGGPTTDLRETVVDSEVIRRGHYLTFRIDTIERADGSRARRDVVGHPGAVAILALDPDDRVLMVRQWRSPADRVMLEVPAGTLDVVDEVSGAVEDHAAAARRELEEETGYRAGSWRLLASFWTAPGFATELMHLYLATDLTPADGERLGPDEDERLELEHVPRHEAVARAERGEIVDAKSLVALLWLDRLARDGFGASATSTTETATVAPEASDEPATTADSGLPGVRIEYVATMGELVLASMAVVRGSLSSQLLGYAGILAGAVLAITSDPIVAILPIALGLALVTGLFAAPFAVATWRRQRDLFTQRTMFKATSRGFDFRAPYGGSALDWSAIRRVRETGAFWFLETGVNSLYLPKRAFSPDQLATFRQVLAGAGFGADGRRRRVVDR